MQAVILAGGKGTRAYPFTEYLPKPMMPVHGKPIIWQVMNLFAQQGITDFLISLGYRKEIIIDYFDNRCPDWNVSLIDTGESTDTGGRIYNLRDHIKGPFIATYVDGLSDVVFEDLLEFHNSHEGLVTVTSVPLVSQYGTIESDENGRVTRFVEKPTLQDYWINAGFFVMDPEVFDHWEGSNLERDVLPKLTKQGLTYVYKHPGYFKSMDTYKDQQEIEENAALGKLLKGDLSALPALGKQV